MMKKQIILLMFVLGFIVSNVFSGYRFDSTYHNSTEPMRCALEINKVFGTHSIVAAKSIKKRRKGQKLKYAQEDGLGYYTFAFRPGAFYGIPKYGIPTADYEDVKIKCMYCPMFHTIILETEDPIACQDMLFAKMLEDSVSMGM